MAAIPVGVAFLLMVPGPETLAVSMKEPARVNEKRDSAINQANFSSVPAHKVIVSTPRLPSRTLPLAIDAKGKLYEPVVPAVYEEPVSASEEVMPSPQSPQRLTELPPLAPAPVKSTEPSA